jgi:hypothetical protein
MKASADLLAAAARLVADEGSSRAEAAGSGRFYRFDMDKDRRGCRWLRTEPLSPDHAERPRPRWPRD